MNSDIIRIHCQGCTTCIINALSLIQPEIVATYITIQPGISVPPASRTASIPIIWAYIR